MGACGSTSLRVPREKRFRRAIKLYEVTEVESMTNLFNRNKCFESGDSPLTLAASEGHEAVVQVLLKGGADVNKVDRNGKCPLHVATHFNDIETVQILLAHGANPNKFDGYNSSPLQIACQRGLYQMTGQLLQSGACVNDGQAGLPPLIYALLNGNTDCVSLLLNHGADVNVTDAKGNTALHIAVAASNARSTAQLLQHGAQPDAHSRDDDTLVCLAALNSCLDTLQALLQAGCDANTHKPEEAAAIIAATARASPRCVDSLIAAGAYFDVHDKKGQSALQIATMSVVDTERESYYCKYFSNVYRTHSKFDPGELNPEDSTRCAMSLVQAGADITRVWYRFSRVFPDPDVITFEQIVLAEVIIQAYGFPLPLSASLPSFMSRVVSVQEYGLLKLLYSVGIEPSWDELAQFGMAADENSRQMFSWARKLRTSPRQLKDLCRRSLRRTMYYNVLFAVEKLEISSDLKDYICIMDTEHYSYVKLD